MVGEIGGILMLAMDAAYTTIQGRTARGILPNPNASDPDGDGLADGQELFVKTAKTPKRYPTRDRAAV